MELQHPIDKHSKRLISRNIELLLDYCMRFYERQFITRSESNKSVLVKFEALLDDYFQSDKPQTDGLPSVKYFADKVFLSPNYFGDLIKKETGKSAQEYIQTRMIDIAKEMIAGTEKRSARLPMNWDSNIRSISIASSRRIRDTHPENTESCKYKGYR